MRIYTLEESGYEDLSKIVEKMQDTIRCAKKLLSEVEMSSESGSRMGWKKKYDDDEDYDDYDWKIKKGYRSRY